MGPDEGELCEYGLPHSLVLIKSYELSLTGMRECVSGVCHGVG